MSGKDALDQWMDTWTTEQWGAALRESEDRIVRMTLTIARLVEHADVLADHIDRLVSEAAGQTQALDEARSAAQKYRDDLDKIVHARTRGKVRRSQERQAKVIQMREAGEKVEYIADVLKISPRRVTELTPRYLKNRR